MDILILLAIFGTIFVWIPLLVIFIGATFNDIALYFLVIFGVFALLFAGISRIERRREARAKAKVYAKFSKLVADKKGRNDDKSNISMNANLFIEEKPEAEASKINSKASGLNI